MKKIAIHLILLWLIAFAIPYKALANFPIGKYRDIVVPTFSYYQQTEKFDEDDKVIKGAPGTGFTSFSANLYIGYGISRRLDFITSIPYLYQINKLAPGNTVINQGLGDMLVGLSYNLVNFDYVRYLSVQVSGVVPLYGTKNTNSTLGLGDYGSEVKLMYCGNLPKDIADKGYFNAEIAYRRYYDSQGPDQVSFTGTVGIPVTRHDQLSMDVVLFRSFSSNKTFNSNLFAERDFAFLKPQLNYGHQFSRRFSAFVGGFYVPFGVNTGVGYGGSVLAVIKL